VIRADWNNFGNVSVISGELKNEATQDELWKNVSSLFQGVENSDALESRLWPSNLSSLANNFEDENYLCNFYSNMEDDAMDTSPASKKGKCSDLEQYEEDSCNVDVSYSSIGNRRIMPGPSLEVS
tara:strand:+ start:496 stop:870 length:375 start_codon:yes stop_codon:yes gene_type:complete